MKQIIFLSGSRKISRLNEDVRLRLANMIQQGFRVIVGDANGADKAMQQYLADMKYKDVVVFCAGGVCRNNIGGWDTKKIDVNPKLKGRDFYAQKDMAMAQEADYGFVLWDGESVGSLNNITTLVKRMRPVVLYLSPEKTFCTLRAEKELEDLTARMSKHPPLSVGRSAHPLSALQESFIF